MITYLVAMILISEYVRDLKLRLGDLEQRKWSFVYFTDQNV